MNISNILCEKIRYKLFAKNLTYKTNTKNVSFGAVADCNVPAAVYSSPIIHRSKIIDESIDILDGYENHQMASMQDLSPDKIVFVHRTDYFPKNGVIQTTYNALRKNGISSDCRNKVHFAINHAVKPVMAEMCNWDDKKYTILLLFDKTMEVNGNEIF